MNILQLIGDMLHLLSFAIIVYKIHRDQSCKGVSCKTQELYLLVFCSRYIDIFVFYSWYNTIMKITFILITLYIILTMRFRLPYKDTYDRAKEDKFPHYYLIIFALFMTLIIHRSFQPKHFIWSFSLWMESVAVFPQITILQESGRAEKFTAHYLATLGSYRFFYILLWIYRYFWQNYFSWVAVLSGTLQVLLYADFFYLYLRNIKQMFISDLPTSNSSTPQEKNIF